MDVKNRHYCICLSKRILLQTDCHLLAGVIGSFGTSQLLGTGRNDRGGSRLLPADFEHEEIFFLWDLAKR